MKFDDARKKMLKAREMTRRSFRGKCLVIATKKYYVLSSSSAIISQLMRHSDVIYRILLKSSRIFLLDPSGWRKTQRKKLNIIVSKTITQAESLHAKFPVLLRRRAKFCHEAMLTLAEQTKEHYGGFWLCSESLSQE